MCAWTGVLLAQGHCISLGGSVPSLGLSVLGDASGPEEDLPGREFALCTSQT